MPPTAAPVEDVCLARLHSIQYVTPFLKATVSGMPEADETSSCVTCHPARRSLIPSVLRTVDDSLTCIPPS